MRRAGRAANLPRRAQRDRLDSPSSSRPSRSRRNPPGILRPVPVMAHREVEHAKRNRQAAVGPHPGRHARVPARAAARLSTSWIRTDSRIVRLRLAGSLWAPESVTVVSSVPSRPLASTSRLKCSTSGRIDERGGRQTGSTASNAPASSRPRRNSPAAGTSACESRTSP